MDKEKFEAIFPIICSTLVEKISISLNYDNQKSIDILYSSFLYENLENEETKLWQYSTEKLFELFLEEYRTGKVTFPQI